jgi:hypothetical protein
LSLTWHGAEALANVVKALQIGIDKTTSQGTIEAKRLVNRDTTTLQGSIHPEPARVNEAGQVEGAYGPHDVAYAVFQEFMPGEWMPDPDGDGESLRRRWGGKPYMRPSQKTVEDRLLPNILEAWRAV